MATEEIEIEGGRQALYRRHLKRVPVTPGELKEGGGRHQVSTEGQTALKRAHAEGKVMEPARAETPVAAGAIERPKP